MNEIVEHAHIIKDERYMALLEELEAAKTETQFNAAMALLNGYHAMGRAMVVFAEQGGISATPLVKEVAADMKYSERNIWDVYRIAQRYETVDDLLTAMEPHGYTGKNISWTACRRHLLNSGSKTDVEVDLGKIARGIVKRYGVQDSKVIVLEIINYMSVVQAESPQEVIEAS